MFKVGDEVVLPLKIEKICNEELVGAKSEADVTYLFKIEEANRVLKPRELKTYTQGLSDAWELARKVYALELDEREKILGYQGLKPILEDLTPEYVADKIEAYEKEKEIKVGDVVNIFHNGSNGVVVRINESGGFNVVLENGLFYADCVRGDLTKTGKHIDIKSLLRQIGE